eukprot:5941807-Prymnesium_polylepis.1
MLTVVLVSAFWLGEFVLHRTSRISPVLTYRTTAMRTIAWKNSWRASACILLYLSISAVAA